MAAEKSDPPRPSVVVMPVAVSPMKPPLPTTPRSRSARLRAAEPVLLTMWREPVGEVQWHLVNTALVPQRVTIVTGGFVSGWVVAPEQAEAKQVFGSDIAVSLDDYKVLRMPPGQS